MRRDPIAVKHVVLFAGLIGLLLNVPAVADSGPDSKSTVTTIRRTRGIRRPGGAEDPRPPASDAKVDPPTVSLLDGLRSGELTVAAEGTGDGRMTLSVTNHSRKTLKVVLPPGLIAAG